MSEIRLGDYVWRKNDAVPEGWSPCIVIDVFKGRERMYAKVLETRHDINSLDLPSAAFVTVPLDRLEEGHWRTTAELATRINEVSQAASRLRAMLAQIEAGMQSYTESDRLSEMSREANFYSRETRREIKKLWVESAFGAPPAEAEEAKND